MSTREQRLTLVYALIALADGYVEEVPPIAKWIAQDKDGEWYWYEKEPTLSENEEMWTNVPPNVQRAEGYEYGAVGVGNIPKDYRQEAYEL